MKVLLLHPEDKFPPSGPASRWDLVVDFGRAPVSTYESWSREAGCRVISLYEFAEEIKDLHRTRNLLQPGMGQIVDRCGIDWWDVLSLEIEPDLQQMMLIHRLAKELNRDCELYSSRPGPLATALQVLLGGELINLEDRFQRGLRGARHYLDVVPRLDAVQLAQVFQDKFDREHSVRRRLARRWHSSGQPLVLLPSAYVNVSRTAVAYAAVLPSQQFLLVCARNTAKLKDLPANVSMTSLDSYFIPADQQEIASLFQSWARLKIRLIASAEEFRAADAVGVLRRMPSLIRWGVAVCNAWKRVFESETFVACLCADDSNPYTRIPLILAKKRGLPAIACHHGAMDSWMATKTQHADFYLAKGEMERDYLLRVCQLAGETIVIGAPNASLAPLEHRNEAHRPWLVFFTEPYEAWAWRRDEVYRDLLPRLSSLAQTCGLKLVFKIHPFESVKSHRRLLRRHLPEEEARQIGVLAGPPSPQLWQNTRFALTVQSTVALECTCLGIPVFLCSWLRDPYNAYLPQYASFGIGQTLNSPVDLERVPQMLSRYEFRSEIREKLASRITPGVLKGMLGGHPTEDVVKPTMLEVS